MKPESVYKMWHQKDVRRVNTRSFEFPEEVFLMGRAENIDYASDKWERDNDFYPYGHYFDSHPFVYGTRGNGRGKDTRSLLQVDDLNGEWDMPVLAYCTQLVYDDNGQMRKLRFSGRVTLTCSNDRKTLVVLSNARPVFIRGGKMIVTDRGIVH